MDIAIIGAGWYGCHLALELAKDKHKITLFEKNDDIFSGISGQFGVRLHAGPHYPRSPATRESCRQSHQAFIQIYPELVVPHKASIYAVGKLDADGKPSKVNLAAFRKVCEEFPEFEAKEITDLESEGYKELEGAFDLKEPSIVVGKGLRDVFKGYLKAAGVEIVYNAEVLKLDSAKITLKEGIYAKTFGKIINASSYQALLPEEPRFPVDMAVVYQPCLALKYRDKQPGSQAISLIMMDGWFPCLMPLVDKLHAQLVENYILTHGKWTILGSYLTSEEAHAILSSLTEEVIDEIRAKSATEMERFWPGFTARFEYVNWQGSVIAKLRTSTEFRSAVTYEKNGIIYVLPGKVSNIFDAAKEVRALIEKKELISNKDYLYVDGGVLDTAVNEITAQPDPGDPTKTCNIQTIHHDLTSAGESLRKSSASLRASTHYLRRCNSSFSFGSSDDLTLFAGSQGEGSSPKQPTSLSPRQ